jgi:hypothetical protein
MDNRQVLIERPSVVPLELRPEGDERHFASITIKGIEEPADDPESSEDVCPLDAPINGPYTIALAGTVKPDDTTVLFGTANYVIRTAQHANKTTYSITGTFYGLDENGDWVETSDDDFYEVRAHDKVGNIVAVGTHDPVDPDNLGVRTGTFTTTAATRIASISVHILGTALRPTTVNYNLADIHLWFPSTANFEWGFTEYGVWARTTNQNYATTTLSGWDYLQDFWFMGSTIYLGAAGEFAEKIFWRSITSTAGHTAQVY